MDLGHILLLYSSHGLGPIHPYRPAYLYILSYSPSDFNDAALVSNLVLGAWLSSGA